MVRTVTVRNFANNAWEWRASVPSLGPTSAANKVTSLADLSVIMRTPSRHWGGALGRERRCSGASFPPGRRLPSGRAPPGLGGGDPGTGNRARTGGERGDGKRCVLNGFGF